MDKIINDLKKELADTKTEFLENAKAIRKSKSKEDRDALIEERNEIQSDISEIEAELKDCYTFVEKKQNSVSAKLASERKKHPKNSGMRKHTRPTNVSRR